MKTRIITAVVAIALIVPFFLFSAPVEASNPLNYLFPLLFALIAGISVFEMLRCLGFEKELYLSIPLIAVAIAAPVLARICINYKAEFIRACFLVTLVAALYIFAVVVFRFEKLDMGKLALLFMTVFYICAANTIVVLMRNDAVAGKFLMLLPFILSWTTDTFAYFCGRIFGKHKLIPNVSPKKTVEGAVGGFLFCAVAAILFGVIVGNCYDVTPNYTALALGGIAAGIVSQIGDLIMSAVKRQSGIKDYGKLLPGHGGMLDRFDSSMAVTVLIAVVNCYFPLFVK